MYDMTLIEKPIEEGLSKEEIVNMLGKLKDDTIYPITIENPNRSSIAMGFITVEFLDRVSEFSICDYIKSILNDMILETDNGEYKFEGFRILLTR